MFVKSPNRIMQKQAVRSPTRRRGTRLATATVMTYNTANGLSIPPVLATNIVSRRKSIPTCTQKSIVRAVEDVHTRSKMAEGIVRA
jgi:hypothetical protein